MKSRKILIASILGNTLEYYEFTIFAVFAGLIGDAFFSSANDFQQVLKTLALFSAGFISRPIGSLVFGHIGDKIGRKLALILTISGMSLATIGIGLTPSYSSIGISAPIILLILRLMQGLFIGGEGAGSAIYVLEHELRFKRDVIGGILISSNISGVLIASLVGIVIEHFIGLDSSSWRIAFIIGGVAGIFVSYLRLTLPETSKYNQITEEEKPKVPAFKLFSKYWREMIVVVAFGGFSSAVSYIVKGYLINHLQLFVNVSVQDSFIYLMYVSVIFAILPPFLGIISHKITPRRFIQCSTALIALLFIPVFRMLSSQEIFIVYTGLTILGFLAAAICTPIFIFFSDMFPTEVRYSGVAISFNLGITLIGGLTPLILTYYTHKTGIFLTPAYYIIALALLYLILDGCFYKRLRKANLA